MQFTINYKNPIAFFVFLSGAFIFSQMFYYLKLNSIFALISAVLICITVVYAVFALKVSEVIVLFMLIMYTRYITGISEKELRDFFPILIILAFLIARPNLFVKFHLPPATFILYAILLLIVIFHNFEFIDSTKATTFTRRWEYFTTLLCFLLGYYLSKSIAIEKLNQLQIGFSLIVLTISTMMFLFNISELPLFNTFSWMKLPFDHRIGILSASATNCILLLLCNKELIRKQYLRVVIVVFAFFGLVAGGGRSSLLSLGLGFLVYLFFIKKKKILTTAIILCLVLVGVSGSFGLKVESLPEKYQRVFSVLNFQMLGTMFENAGKDQELENVKEFVSSEADWSSFYRLYMWNKAFMSIAEKPFFGAGIQNPFKGEDKATFDFIHEATSPDALLLSGTLHNTFFSLAYIAGIPAMVIFFFFLLSCWLKIKKMANSDTSYNYLFVFISTCFFINSLTGDLFLSEGFMLSAGVVFSHYRIFYKKTLLKKENAVNV